MAFANTFIHSLALQYHFLNTVREFALISCKRVITSIIKVHFPLAHVDLLWNLFRAFAILVM
jgi:hypothetical protein